jgi:hypothetical protein
MYWQRIYTNSAKGRIFSNMLYVQGHHLSWLRFLEVFVSPSQAHARIEPKITLRPILSLFFTIHNSPYHSTACNLATDSVVKKAKRKKYVGDQEPAEIYSPPPPLDTGRDSDICGACVGSAGGRHHWSGEWRDARAINMLAGRVGLLFSGTGGSVGKCPSDIPTTHHLTLFLSLECCLTCS